jgi:hypothetical protein
MMNEQALKIASEISVWACALAAMLLPGVAVAFACGAYVRGASVAGNKGENKKYINQKILRTSERIFGQCCNRFSAFESEML